MPVRKLEGTEPTGRMIHWTVIAGCWRFNMFEIFNEMRNCMFEIFNDMRNCR
jgi:hypothetical protein